MAGVFVGATEASRVYVGSTQAKIYVGSTFVHPIPDAMGMDKSGVFNVSPANGTPVKVTGWTVRAGFPNTQIVNDELVMNGHGNVTITYRGDLAGNFGTRTFYAYKNGVQQDSVTDATEDTTASIPVAPGDTIALYASTTSVSGDDVQPGSAVTYIYVTIL
jgi:hypothetical protein